MNWSYNESFMLRGYCLKENINSHLNIILSNRSTSIVRGIVYSSDGEISCGAAIEIKQINPINCQSHIVGYTYTNNCGEYVFALEANPCMFYEITVYAPLGQ